MLAIFYTLFFNTFDTKIQKYCIVDRRNKFGLIFESHKFTLINLEKYILILDDFLTTRHFDCRF